MINLAGHADPDPIVERELVRCRIEAVRGERSKGEVGTSITGRLGAGFTFKRAWRYWVASGPVPLDVADELYADPVGREDVRVAGHCGCPAPRDHGVTWYGGDGVRLLETGEREELLRYLASGSQGMKESAARMLDDCRFVDDPAAVGRGFVELYHIDSEVGLRLFADTIRRHGLDGREERSCV
jgi:hypothetical protein